MRQRVIFIGTRNDLVNMEPVFPKPLSYRYSVNDAISDLEDIEVKYHICCFGDFYAAERANRHFILTMERTIREGYPYCDSVFHSTDVLLLLYAPWSI